MKFGIVSGAVYGLISLIFIPFFLIALVAGMLVPNHDSGGQFGQAIGAGVGLFFCIVAPFFYALFGFLFGALAALIYNLVAKWTGGIEFEVE